MVLPPSRGFTGHWAELSLLPARDEGKQGRWRLRKPPETSTGGQGHPGPGLATPKVLLHSEGVQEGAVLSNCHVGAKQSSPRTAAAAWQRAADGARGGTLPSLPAALGAQPYLGSCFLCPFRSDFMGQAWTWVCLGLGERDGTIPPFSLHSQPVSPFWLFTFPASPAFSLPCWRGNTKTEQE